jgi:hypothetical protein
MARKTCAAGSDKGTVRFDLAVFGSVTSSLPLTLANVPRTRSVPASRSTSDHCRANASPRLRPLLTSSSKSGA